MKLNREDQIKIGSVLIAVSVALTIDTILVSGMSDMLYFATFQLRTLGVFAIGAVAYTASEWTLLRIIGDKDKKSAGGRN